VHITACYKNLAGHDLYVGIFYYKKKRYKAALQRFLAVIEKYPDTGEHQRSLAYIANCEAFLQQEAEAAK
jgi:outer membrane protein assembly factor BamD